MHNRVNGDRLHRRSIEAQSMLYPTEDDEAKLGGLPFARPSSRCSASLADSAESRFEHRPEAGILLEELIHQITIFTDRGQLKRRPSIYRNQHRLAPAHTAVTQLRLGLPCMGGEPQSSEPATSCLNSCRDDPCGVPVTQKVRPQFLRPSASGSSPNRRSISAMRRSAAARAQTSPDPPAPIRRTGLSAWRSTPQDRH